jgi:hypothetical protein
MFLQQLTPQTRRNRNDSSKNNRFANRLFWLGRLLAPAQQSEPAIRNHLAKKKKEPSQKDGIGPGKSEPIEDLPRRTHRTCEKKEIALDQTRARNLTASR